MVNARQYIVYTQINKWRNLKAWGKSLDYIHLEISTREYPKRAGTYWLEEQRVVIYNQPGMPGIVGMLKTGVHEFAHAVAEYDGHGDRWQKVYSDAIKEITGEFISFGFRPHTKLDEKAYQAMVKWWRNSGAEVEAKRFLNERR